MPLLGTSSLFASVRQQSTNLLVFSTFMATSSVAGRLCAPAATAKWGPFLGRAGQASRAMALTDVAVRSAKPREKDYKLADNAGLYLLVTPSGGKL